jgi:hypothetical protein
LDGLSCGLTTRPCRYRVLRALLATHGDNVMEGSIELRVRDLEKQVQTFKNLVWVIGTLAVVFGVSGAWGLQTLSAAQKRITDVEAQVDSVEKIFNNQRQVAEANFKASLDSISLASTKRVSDEMKASEAAFSRRLAALASGNYKLSKADEDKIHEIVMSDLDKTFGQIATAMKSK